MHLRHFSDWLPLSVLAGLASLSFVAVVAAVELFALQVSSGEVDARDLHAKPVDAPADAPPPPAGRLALRVKWG